MSAIADMKHSLLSLASEISLALNNRSSVWKKYNQNKKVKPRISYAGKMVFAVIQAPNGHQKNRISMKNCGLCPCIQEDSPHKTAIVN